MTKEKEIAVQSPELIGMYKRLCGIKQAAYLIMFFCMLAFLELPLWCLDFMGEEFNTNILGATSFKILEYLIEAIYDPKIMPILLFAVWVGFAISWHIMLISPLYWAIRYGRYRKDPEKYALEIQYTVMNECAVMPTHKTKAEKRLEKYSYNVFRYMAYLPFMYACINFLLIIDMLMYASKTNPEITEVAFTYVLATFKPSFIIFFALSSVLLLVMGFFMEKENEKVNLFLFFKRQEKNSSEDGTDFNVAFSKKIEEVKSALTKKAAVCAFGAVVCLAFLFVPFFETKGKYHSVFSGLANIFSKIFEDTALLNDATLTLDMLNFVPFAVILAVCAFLQIYWCITSIVQFNRFDKYGNEAFYYFLTDASWGVKIGCTKEDVEKRSPYWRIGTYNQVRIGGSLAILSLGIILGSGILWVFHIMSNLIEDFEDASDGLFSKVDILGEPSAFTVFSILLLILFVVYLIVRVKIYNGARKIAYSVIDDMYAIGRRRETEEKERKEAERRERERIQAEEEHIRKMKEDAENLRRSTEEMKQRAIAAAQAAVSQMNLQNQNSETAREDNIELLLKYKKLLDDGVITQEEFDKKKEELL